MFDIRNQVSYNLHFFQLIALKHFNSFSNNQDNIYLFLWQRIFRILPNVNERIMSSSHFLDQNFRANDDDIVVLEPCFLFRPDDVI